MTARFEVEDAFVLQSRGMLFVHGRITEGAVRMGQHVVSPAALNAAVAAVEVVTLSAERGKANPALGFHYRDESELAQWQGLDLRGKTIELADCDVD